jgi:undecaprenyl-diphosphatase
MNASRKPPDPLNWHRVVSPVRVVVEGGRSLLQWIGQHEIGVLITLLITAVAIWAFVALANKVVRGRTSEIDEWAVKALRQADDPSRPLGPKWLAEVGRDVTALGGVSVLVLLIAAVSGFLWLKRMYAAMTLVTLAALGGLLVSFGLKELFARPRPNVVPHLAEVYTSSFPSGHSMLSATVYLTLGVLLGEFVESRTLRAYFLLVALVLTLLVGVSRVYLGVHYPSDVLGGWAAGLAWALICSLLARALKQRGLATADTEPSRDISPP